jgi:hypothetical protein
LFSNVWYGAKMPNTVIRNITALSSQLAYEETVTTNLTTLTMTNAETTSGVVKGLLYVPTIAAGHPCEDLEKQYLPTNVTRAENLPPGRLKLIALAPWFNISCTQAYLEAAREDPIRGFVFYRPNNSTDKPQSVDSPVWNLDDGGAWKKENPFPIFALPGEVGGEMMRELGRYSGDVADVPHGSAISQLYKPNARDYVRIFTELTVETPSDLPAMWKYFLIVLLVLLFVVVGVVALLHLMNWKKRAQLRRRVKAGEVDLEAMGIKRVTVPAEYVESFPLFVYMDVDKRKREGDEVGIETPPAAATTTATPALAATPAITTTPAITCTTPAMTCATPAITTASASASATSPTTPAVSMSRSPHPIGSSVVGGTVTGGTVVGESIQGSRGWDRSTALDGRVPARPQMGRSGQFTSATNHQPDCHICLEPFQEYKSVVRQLPCGHIYHQVCIDELLLTTSSLCLICKQCMLPAGYCPKITNAMVRKERNIRQLRSKVLVESLDEDKSWKSRWRSLGRKPSVEIELTPIPHSPSSNPFRDGSTASGGRPDSGRIQDDSGAMERVTSATSTSTASGTDGGNRAPSALARRTMRDVADALPNDDDEMRHSPLWKRSIRRIFPRVS